MGLFQSLLKGKSITNKDVTVIIPAFISTTESFRWLIEAIDSALDQDCPVVVYDDGSPVDITDEIKLMYTNTIKWIRAEENRGVSHARNMAVMNIETPLFIPLDCDDRLVKGAVKKMVAKWEGVPVYTDISKFGTETVPYYKLLDFSCDAVRSKLGVAAVSVLQSVTQWKSIGGWDETINLYEDSEYNARLFLTFCAVKIFEPLLEYRQHNTQKTKRLIKESASAGRSILYRIRRLPMACRTCGGARRSKNLSVTTPDTTNVGVSTMGISLAEKAASLPGTKDGRVLAHYVGGKGRGSHYYRGISTAFPYKVVYDGLYYVDPHDTTLYNSKSFFEIVKKDSEVVTAVSKKPAVEKTSEASISDVPADAIVSKSIFTEDDEVAFRQPVVSVEKTPVVSEVLDTEVVKSSDKDLPDISNMTHHEIRDLDLTQEQAAILYQREKEGRNRTNVLSSLEKKMG